VPGASAATRQGGSDVLDRALADSVAGRAAIGPFQSVPRVASPVLQRYVVKAALVEKPAPQFEAQEMQNTGSFRDAHDNVVVHLARPRRTCACRRTARWRSRTRT